MKKYKVLGIDDSKAVHAFLKDCLTEITQEFKSAMDGSEALQILKENPSYFDIIFLDWEMPNLNGPDTFMQMKSLGVKTPVVMLTSKNNPSDIMQMLAAGVSEYIMKPFDKELIVEKISFLLP